MPLADVMSGFVFARVRRRVAGRLTDRGVLLQATWSGRRAFEPGPVVGTVTFTDIAYADDEHLVGKPEDFEAALSLLTPSLGARGLARAPHQTKVWAPAGAESPEGSGTQAIPGLPASLAG